MPVSAGRQGGWSGILFAMGLRHRPPQMYALEWRWESTASRGMSPAQQPGRILLNTESGRFWGSPKPPDCPFSRICRVLDIFGSQMHWVQSPGNGRGRASVGDPRARTHCGQAARNKWRLTKRGPGAETPTDSGSQLALRIDSNRFILGRIDSNRNDSDSISGRIANRIGMNQNATSSVEHPPMTNVQTHTDFVARACSSVGTSAA